MCNCALNPAYESMITHSNFQNCLDCVCFEWHGIFCAISFCMQLFTNKMSLDINKRSKARQRNAMQCKAMRQTHKQMKSERKIPLPWTTTDLIRKLSDSGFQTRLSHFKQNYYCTNGVFLQCAMRMVLNVRLQLSDGIDDFTQLFLWKRFHAQKSK